MKNEVSYSFHVSNGDHSKKNANQLLTATCHNSRLYEDKKGYNPNENVILRGTNNLYQDVKQLYDDTFKGAVALNNITRTRTKEKIDDYFLKVSNSAKQHVAEEIIIQIGDKEFYENRDYKVHKEEYNKLFEEQLERLEEKCPNFKIANAIIHYDETSPHVHIIGVPIKEFPDSPMYVRVSKRDVFNQKSLTMLQEEMRKGVAEQVQQIYQEEQITEQAKQKGRNVNLNVVEYKYIKIHEKELEQQFSERFKETENKLEDKFNEQVKELEEKSNQKILEMTNDLTENERKALLHQDYKDLSKVYGKKMDNLNEEIKKIDIPKIIEEKKQEIKKKVEDDLQEYLNKVAEEHKLKVKALNEKNEKDFQERKIENEKKMKILDSEINTRTKEKDDLIANKNFLEKTINSLRDIVRKTLGLKNLEEFEKYAEQVRINAIKIKETIEKVLGRNGSIEDFTDKLEKMKRENDIQIEKNTQLKLENDKEEKRFNKLKACEGNFLEEAIEEYDEYIKELYEKDMENIDDMRSYEHKQRYSNAINNIIDKLDDACRNSNITPKQFHLMQINTKFKLENIARCIFRQELPTREDLEDKYDENDYVY